MPEFDEQYLRLSLQRALIGSVSQTMVGFTAGLFGKKIHLRAYYKGPITQDHRDRTGTIGADVIADFPADFDVEEESLDVADSPLKILRFWAFLREEHPPIQY